MNLSDSLSHFASKRKHAMYKVWAGTHSEFVNAYGAAIFIAMLSVQTIYGASSDLFEYKGKLGILFHCLTFSLLVLSCIVKCH